MSHKVCMLLENVYYDNQDQMTVFSATKFRSTNRGTVSHVTVLL